MSRLNLATEAVRKAMKGRALLSGPAGAGKTRTGLAIATVLAEGGKILGIDTERETMLTYAVSEDNPTGYEFTHLPWREPFDVVELTDTINEAGQEYAAILVDSITHFWKESGGVLDLVDGKFGGWKGARPVLAKFVTAVLDSPAHVILCTRSKQGYAQRYDEQAKKNVVDKLGMEIEYSKDLEYEVQVALDLDMSHALTVTKSRSDAVPVGKTYAAHSEREFATQYAEWLRAGEPFADLDEQARIDTARRELDPDQKRMLWDLWQKHALPSPENMTATHVAIADRLIEQVTAGPKTRGTKSAGKLTGQAAALRAAADDAQHVQPEPANEPDPTQPASTPEPAEPMDVPVGETQADMDASSEATRPAEAFPESDPTAAGPFGEDPQPESSSADWSGRAKVRESKLRESLVKEAEKRWGDDWAEAAAVALEIPGCPAERIANDELRGLLFDKAS